MLLKNVQIDDAIALCKDVIHKCKTTHIFIDGTELSLNITMGGIVFDVNKAPEQMIQEAKEQLQLAQKEGESLKFSQAKVQDNNSLASDDDDADSFELPGDGFGSFDDFDLS